MKAGMESGMDKAVCLKGLKLGPETNWEQTPFEEDVPIILQSELESCKFNILKYALLHNITVFVFFKRIKIKSFTGHTNCAPST